MLYFFRLGGGGGGGGAGESDFFTMNPSLKFFFFFLERGGGGGEGGVNRTDDWLSCSLAVHFRKAFQQGTIGQHCVGPKISFTDEMFEVICSYLTRSWTHVFVIVKTNAFGIDGGRLVLGLFYILNT